MSGGNVTIGQFNTTTTPVAAGDSFAAYQATASATVRFLATQVAAYVATATAAGFGTMAFQNATGVAITGGVVTASGGTLTGYTAITTAALTATAATIAGGTINGTSVGASSRSSGAFTTLSATGAFTATGVAITGGTVTATGGTLTAYTAITTGALTATGGLIVSGGGAAITGNSTIGGTLVVTATIANPGSFVGTATTLAAFVIIDGAIGGGNIVSGLDLRQSGATKARWWTDGNGNSAIEGLSGVRLFMALQAASANNYVRVTPSNGGNPIVDTNGGNLAVTPLTAFASGITIAGGATVGTSAITTIGVVSGTGAPSASMPQGTIYLRTDGTATNTRMYVNTTGSTVWAGFFTTA